MNIKFVDKFFINQATQEETEQVLKWFDTLFGQKYLQERFDIDYTLMDRKEFRIFVSELNSKLLYKSVNKGIKSKRQNVKACKPGWFGYVFKAAAILGIVLISVFFMMNYPGPINQVVKEEPVYVQTNNDENREIVLSGSSIDQLNNNSEILISKDFCDMAYSPDYSHSSFSPINPQIGFWNV